MATEQQTGEQSKDDRFPAEKESDERAERRAKSADQRKTVYMIRKREDCAQLAEHALDSAVYANVVVLLDERLKQAMAERDQLYDDAVRERKAFQFAMGMVRHERAMAKLVYADRDEYKKQLCECQKVLANEKKLLHDEIAKTIRFENTKALRKLRAK